MSFSRREFVKKSLSALGVLALDGLPVFAAPAGFKPSKKPNLAFGILTDTHYRVEWNGKTLTIAVRPLSSLGTKGKPLVVTYSTASGSVRPRKV